MAIGNSSKRGSNLQSWKRCELLDQTQQTGYNPKPESVKAPEPWGADQRDVENKLPLVPQNRRPERPPAK